MAVKSKILILGATGLIGKYIVLASAEAGHPTFALVRKSALSHPQKSKLIEDFKNAGVTLIYGDITDQETLANAIKQVDVVISAVGKEHVNYQVKIIEAIKEAGNIKRFFPSEFGGDVDHHNAAEPAATLFEEKVQIRRQIEAEGIPYTYVISNAFMKCFLPTLVQRDATAPPRDKVFILGDGNVKGVYVTEEDIATYTIKAVDDPRTLNKILYLQPPPNILTFNEIVSMWENKIKTTLQRIYVPEHQILKDIEETTDEEDKMRSVLNLSVLVRGDTVGIDIDPAVGVEASELYPEVKYTTADKFLDAFV